MPLSSVSSAALRARRLRAPSSSTTPRGLVCWHATLGQSQVLDGNRSGRETSLSVHEPEQGPLPVALASSRARP
eukprot:142189-Rhodomonas_salina.2